MPPSREPWIKLKVGLRRSDKIASLPSDAARWGWVCVLIEAKVQRRMGVFASRHHLRTVISPLGRFINAWITAGLLHEWPTDCRCAGHYDDVEDGELIVHDFRQEQRDPTASDRQATWRANADRNGVRNGVRNGDRNGAGNGKRNADVTSTVTPYSRARGTTVTVTGTERDSKGVHSAKSLDGERPPGNADAPSDHGDEISRARARLADPKTSPAVREAAIAQLNLLGVPHEPGDELDFGEAVAS